MVAAGISVAVAGRSIMLVGWNDERASAPLLQNF